ncbi:MAG: DUF1015 domain-containing protein [Clostridia bacterium]|nr:DUF1015 domain-containing protein [Clostridia bacterium]
MSNHTNPKTGVHIPTILMPTTTVDLTKWSVVACDQYTSQEEYWDKVEETVGSAYSTFRLTLPEVYLEKTETEDRIKKINGSMKEYLKEGVLVPLVSGMVYVDRKTSHVESRKGLILAVDLEKYDYTKGSQTLIRATEGTVLERIPPRVKIRENAVIESPHIMLLIDDPDRTVIEPLAANAYKLEKLYDFELMMNGGHIQGYKVESTDAVEGVLNALEKLAKPEVFKNKYGVGDDKGVLLFAVGDGNHSLASAKAHWVNVKETLSESEQESHPARFALVEVVNVHDSGITFEPIHRVVFNIDTRAFLNQMVDFFNKMNCQAAFKVFDSEKAMKSEVIRLKSGGAAHVIPFVSKDTYGVFSVNCPKLNLEVGTLQTFIDEYVKENKDAKVDYIHGDDVVVSLGSKEGNIGFFLPAMDKHDLFKTVILDGSLPRKTFSMGEAEEKRFYLECRKIVKG